MSRLTKHCDYCVDSECIWYDKELAKDNKCECNKSRDNCHDRSIYNKLREYEDLEEQGLLLKLPCKVGDKAYYVHKGSIDEVEVDSFVLNVNLFVNVSYYIGCDRFGKTLTPYKTLFFTKEEAEETLKRLECAE